MDNRKVVREANMVIADNCNMYYEEKELVDAISKELLSRGLRVMRRFDYKREMWQLRLWKEGLEEYYKTYDWREVYIEQFQAL